MVAITDNEQNCNASQVRRQTPGLGSSHPGASQLAIQQTPQTSHDNKAKLMIDSGAATHVCPNGLPQIHRSIRSNMDRGRNLGQQQMKASQYTGTNGSTCAMNSNNL